MRIPRYSFFDEIYYRTFNWRADKLCGQCYDLANEIEEVYENPATLPSPKMRKRIHKMYQRVAIKLGMATRRNAKHVIDTMMYDLSYPNWKPLWVENNPLPQDCNNWRELWLGELKYFSDRWSYIRLCRSIYAYGQWMADVTNHDWMYLLD